MGPLPKRVEAAGIAGLRRKCTPASIVPRDFFDDADRARALFARLIGTADASRVAIIPAVSYGIALVANNTPCAAGQNIVVTGEQFPSNVYAWRRLAERAGATMRAVPAPASSRRGEAWNDALLDAIDESTAVVALPQVHWTDGTRFALECLGARARQAGAAFVIDATQSVGAYPFDLAGFGADAVVCAAYKWLLGPYGIGAAWLGPRYDDGEPLEETWIGRAASEDFRGLVNYRDDYQPGAARFDVGERSNFALLPMLVAGLEMVLEWRAHRIQAYCAELIAPVIQAASELGFGIEDGDWRGNHLFGLRTPAGLDLASLDATLRSRGISASLRGSALRLSPHVYNDEQDIEALIGALRESREAGAVAVTSSA
jgi:selenocysteine lyase/cysteine desulfurase